MKIGGASAGTLNAEFQVSANLEGYNASIDAAVQSSTNALAKEDKKWTFSRTSWENTMERARNRQSVSFRMVLRSIISEVNQTWNIISQIFGLGKNIVFTIITQAISTISSLIATAYSAAAIWAGVPGAGPFMASLMIANAVGATYIQVMTLAQQARIQAAFDTVGNQLSGWTF